MKTRTLIVLIALGACGDPATPVGKAKLTVTASALPTELTVGMTPEVTFTAKNVGDGKASVVTIEVHGTDALAIQRATGCDLLDVRASCDLGELAAGASVQTKIVFEVKAVAGATFTFSARSPESGEVTGVPPGGNNNNNNTGGPSKKPSELTFSFVTVDDQNSGWQPEIKAKPGGGVGVAFLRRKTEDSVCTKMGGSKVAGWEVMYAESTGADFTVQKVADTDLVEVDGVSLAFDDAGNPAVAFMGGAEAMYRCGGSDIMLARRAGNTWSVNALDSNGMATPVFPEDVEACALYQNVCNAAAQDVVGPWPAVTFVGSTPFVAYRDVHFGFAQDDDKNADLEMQFGGTDGTLDATYGGGVYTKAAVKNGEPAVVHLNRYNGDNGEGIWIVEHDGGAWSRKRISTEVDVGYTLGFATKGSLAGVAYNAKGKKKLYYLEAADGRSWSSPEVVDQDGDTGQSPSLAFDSSGAPAISYYLCGPYDPNSSGCKSTKDGLRYAIKIDGRWEKATIRSESAVFDGLNTSLAFDGGEPVIAFQAQSFDAASNTVIRELVVARGKAK